jgi:hypothetical protein
MMVSWPFVDMWHEVGELNLEQNLKYLGKVLRRNFSEVVIVSLWNHKCIFFLFAFEKDVWSPLLTKIA